MFTAGMLHCGQGVPAEAEPLGIYVAIDGGDENPGTEAEPFRTLDRARNAIRALKKSRGFRAGGITVWIRGGVYHLNKIFELSGEDSGSPAAPIEYRAYGRDKVWLSGGRRIATSHFRPVTDPAVLERIGAEALRRIQRVAGYQLVELKLKRDRAASSPQEPLPLPGVIVLFVALKGVKSWRIVLQWLWHDCDRPLALLPDAAPCP